MFCGATEHALQLMQEGESVCSGATEHGSPWLAVVAEYKYEHAGREDAILYLLDAENTEQLISFNGCVYHGKWSRQGHLLHLEFHCSAKKDKMKQHTLVHAPNSCIRFKSVIPSKPVKITLQKLWAIPKYTADGNLEVVWEV